MKQTSSLSIFFVCLTLFLCACGAKEPDPPGTMPPPAPAEKPQDVTWNFQKNAISLTIIASEHLNMIKDAPHAVSICVYQTDNPELLQAKAETEQGLRELLMCTSNPPERIQAQRMYIQPASIIERKLDRAEKARYIAVVAGFNSLSPETCFSITPIPLHSETTQQWTLVFSKELYNTADMKVRIDLSSESVHLQGAKRVQE